ncbi:MAG: hypothetical protein EXR99_05720 [Gemmataceae bacterium]|nr:hypothetical protein [Gemmataceae bacterium]
MWKLGFLTFWMLLGQSPGKAEPNPIAPSLPNLTEAQEARLDKIINRFIQFDIGRLPGPEGIQAFEDFRILGYEATPALLRGLQTASKLEHSCPVTLIATKLKKILANCKDPELLDFTKDEIASAMEGSPHGVILRDLRNRVNIRRNAVAALLPPVPRWLLDLSVEQMVQSLKNEENQGKHLLMAKELARRNTPEALGGLGLFAVSFYPKVRDPSKELLKKSLNAADAKELGKYLKDENEVLRQMAAEAVGHKKHLSLAPQLIPLLADDYAPVGLAAKKALALLSEKNFGPKENASPAEVQEAIRQWTAWWETRGATPGR